MRVLLSGMAALLITYRFVVSPSQQQFEAIQAALKSTSGGHVRLAEGCYVIETDRSPEAVYEQLRRFVHKNDLLLVLRVGRPYFGQHRSDVVQWLNARL
jgi:hypothetical protein